MRCCFVFCAVLLSTHLFINLDIWNLMLYFLGPLVEAFLVPYFQEEFQQCAQASHVYLVLGSSKLNEENIFVLGKCSWDIDAHERQPYDTCITYCQIRYIVCAHCLLFIYYSATQRPTRGHYMSEQYSKPSSSLCTLLVYMKNKQE